MSKAWRTAQRQNVGHCKGLGAANWILQSLVNILKASEAATGEGPCLQLHGRNKRVTLSRMKRQENNEESFPTKRSGVSSLQPSVQGRRKKASFRKEKKVIPGIVLLASEEGTFVCSAKQGNKNTFSVLVKNCERCKTFLNYVQFSAFESEYSWNKKCFPRKYSLLHQLP